MKLARVYVVGECGAPIGGRGEMSASPGHCHCIAFLDTGKTTVLATTVPLFTKVYRWVPMTSMLGVTMFCNGLL